jgi:chitin disaccharide deacetylase
MARASGVQLAGDGPIPFLHPNTTKSSLQAKLLDMIIVNADDFGLCSEVNRTIISCFERAAISSTTVMANMPGFEEACELVHHNRLTSNVGIHFNLTRGIPLTSEIRRQRTFCNSDGFFSYSNAPWRLLNAYEKSTLMRELQAQINRCRAHRLPLTHADSHHHVHATLGIFPVVSAVLREFGIRNLRLSRNVGTMSLAKRGLKWMFNMWIRMHGFNTTTYFGDILSFQAMIRRPGATTRSFEIMVHPGLGEDGTAIDTVHGFLIIPTLQRVLNGVNIRPYPLG